MAIWVDLEGPDCLDTPVLVGGPVEMLEGTLGGAISTTSKER